VRDGFAGCLRSFFAPFPHDELFFSCFDRFRGYSRAAFFPTIFVYSLFRAPPSSPLIKPCCFFRIASRSGSCPRPPIFWFANTSRLLTGFPSFSPYSPTSPSGISFLLKYVLEPYFLPVFPPCILLTRATSICGLSAVFQPPTVLSLAGNSSSTARGESNIPFRKVPVSLDVCVASFLFNFFQSPFSLDLTPVVQSVLAFFFNHVLAASSSAVSPPPEP